ncbi:DMT family transporter [Plasticicumulans acidivorans]|uniref:Threonine/homoserine efflux transporter RhtA n=1 Tax=Plasticicumulans acidivorans TaxID=886464 RepID=A0A317MUK4_9GAMM|nr:DMT family transporter [Plasticicumulans acidivorans]PWV61653.1 threonine/homoserine efflux transporter RhtA [Plasticicumulans acidivorans]
MQTEAVSRPLASHRDWYGIALVVLSATGFSAKAIFIKLAFRWPVDAVTLLMLRMALALPFFLLAAWWSTRGATQAMTRRDWLAVIALGIAGYYLASLFDFLGLQYISASLERLILFLYPTLVVLIRALLGHRPSGREWGALALSYAGMALVVAGEGVGAQRELYWGVALVFLSSLSYAVYLVGSGAMIARLGATRFTALALLVSTTGVLLHYALANGVRWPQVAPPVWGLALAMALISTVLPTFLMSAGIRRLGAGRASLIASVGPVLTIAMGAVFLGESILPLQWLGAALVISGVLLVSLKKS